MSCYATLFFRGLPIFSGNCDEVKTSFVFSAETKGGNRIVNNWQCQSVRWDWLPTLFEGEWRLNDYAKFKIKQIKLQTTFFLKAYFWKALSWKALLLFFRHSPFLFTTQKAEQHKKNIEKHSQDASVYIQNFEKVTWNSFKKHHSSSFVEISPNTFLRQLELNRDFKGSFKANRFSIAAFFPTLDSPTSPTKNSFQTHFQTDSNA